jgi:hypothetical protein
MNEFLVEGQPLTPPAGPRPRNHKPGESRTLSSEDFERPCRPVAACAPLANGFHTRNYRLERLASRGRCLSESDANNGLAWHSPLHPDEAHHQASIDPMRKSAPRNGALGRVQFRPSTRQYQTFIRRIGCFAGRDLDAKRRSRSRCAKCRYPLAPCHLDRTRWLVASGVCPVPETRSNIS